MSTKLVLCFACFLVCTIVGSAGPFQGPAGEVISRPANPSVTPARVKPRRSRSGPKSGFENELLLGNKIRGSGKEFSWEYNYDGAQKHYLRAIALNPSDWRGYYGLANVHLDRRRYAAAALGYEQALRLKSDEPAIYDNLAWCYWHEKRLDDALRSYRELIKLDKSNANAYADIGSISEEQKRYPEAIEAYREALKVAPDAGWVHFPLAGVLRKEKRFSEAAEEYKQAILHGKGRSDRIHFDLGEMYLFEMNDRASATEQYEILLKLNPPLASLFWQEMHPVAPAKAAKP